MKVNNLITLNEKVIAQVWIKSIQIMCYDFYNIFYRKWEKEKRVKPTHANEFFLLSALTNKIMITVYKANVNQVDAESYKKFTETLNLYSLICPKCKHHDFQKHGYYTRKVKYRKHSVTLRILRVKCMSCKSTHAVLLYFIVPYSQYALEVHLKALQSDFLNRFIDWIEWNEEINEYSYYYIRSQFQKYWKERLMSESMRLNTDLFKSCFKFFSLQFMQIKCTRNIFLSLST